MAFNLKKFPVQLAVAQDNGKYYVYGAFITNFIEVTEKIDETNELLTETNTLLVDANGHLTDINGNLVTVNGHLVDIKAELVTANSHLTDIHGDLVTSNSLLNDIKTSLGDQNSVFGTTDDTAVTTDANGTISAKLRGVIVHLLALINGQGTTTDAAVYGDNNASISAKLRAISIRVNNLLPPAQMNSGSAIVTTAGTRVRLSVSSVAMREVIISAMQSNTKPVVVGASNVVGAAGSSRIGATILPGENLRLPIDNLNKVYLDSEVDGEGVTFTAVIS